MIYKAQSPAGFAEEYIVESIWSGRFPPGTILPAERELSELIGVTRTTLREVLQRLARDGWLTIQHGKPTKVNNYWETCGLNILETLARLDPANIKELVDNLLAARTNVSAVFIRGAFKQNPDRAREIIARHAEIEQTGLAFAEFDYQMNHDLAFAWAKENIQRACNITSTEYAADMGFVCFLCGDQDVLAANFIQCV